MIDSYSISDYKSTSYKEGGNSKTFLDMTMEELLAHNEYATKRAAKIKTRKRKAAIEIVADLEQA